MKKQALFCMLLAGTLMVGGCGQKAADPAADTTAQVTEASDSAPADKPDGAPGENSDRPGNPPDGTPGNMDGHYNMNSAHRTPEFLGILSHHFRSKSFYHNYIPNRYYLYIQTQTRFHIFPSICNVPCLFRKYHNSNRLHKRNYPSLWPFLSVVLQGTKRDETGAHT